MTGEQARLRAMTREEQSEWMISRARYLGFSLFSVSVNNVCVVVGRGGEEAEMFERFVAAVNGPDLVEKVGEVH